MGKVTVGQAKQWREQVGAEVLIVITVDPDGTQHIATHGRTRPQARDAANIGNQIKKGLGWPLELCSATPVHRICKNCAYFKEDRGIHCVNGWSGDGSRGNCLFAPVSRPMTNSDDTCGCFEPK